MASTTNPYGIIGGAMLDDPTSQPQSVTTSLGTVTSGMNLGPSTPVDVGASANSNPSTGSPLAGYTYDAATGTYNHTTAPWQTANSAPAPAPAANPYNYSNMSADTKKQVNDWYRSIVELQATNPEAARAQYLKEQQQLGFTDADFAPVTAANDINGGVGFTADQIAAWKNGTPAPAASAPAASAAPTGIVANAMQANQAASTYQPALLGTPTQWTVTPNQTVQGQMKDLIDPNNPYYQQWATAGAQTANARGLLNSSIGEGLVLDSVMRGATPIATADANTNANAAATNAGAANTFAQANQNAANSAGQFNAGSVNDLTKANLSANTQIATTSMNNATTLANTKLSTDSQQYIAKLNADTQTAVTKMNNDSQQAISAAHDANSTLLATNSQASQLFNTYVQDMASIDTTTGITPDEKAQREANLTQAVQSGLAAFHGGSTIPDVSSILASLSGIVSGAAS